MERARKELKLSSSKKPFFIPTGYCHGGNSDQGIGGGRAPKWSLSQSDWWMKGCLSLVLVLGSFSLSLVSSSLGCCSSFLDVLIWANRWQKQGNVSQQGVYPHTRQLHSTQGQVVQACDPRPSLLHCGHVTDCGGREEVGHNKRFLNTQQCKISSKSKV